MVEQGFCKAQVASSNLVRGSQWNIVQLVEHLTVNEVVVGSSPTVPVAPVAQLVEHGFCKAEVACSSHVRGFPFKLKHIYDN